MTGKKSQMFHDEFQMAWKSGGSTTQNLAFSVIHDELLKTMVERGARDVTESKIAGAAILNMAHNDFLARLEDDLDTQLEEEAGVSVWTPSEVEFSEMDGKIIFEEFAEKYEEQNIDTKGENYDEEARIIHPICTYNEYADLEKVGSNDLKQLSVTVGVEEFLEEATSKRKKALFISNALVVYNRMPFKSREARIETKRQLLSYARSGEHPEDDLITRAYERIRDGEIFEEVGEFLFDNNNNNNSSSETEKEESESEEEEEELSGYEKKLQKKMGQKKESLTYHNSVGGPLEFASLKKDKSIRQKELIKFIEQSKFNNSFMTKLRTKAYVGSPSYDTEQYFYESIVVPVVAKLFERGEDELRARFVMTTEGLKIGIFKDIEEFKEIVSEFYTFKFKDIYEGEDKIAKRLTKELNNISGRFANGTPPGPRAKKQALKVNNRKEYGEHGLISYYNALLDYDNLVDQTIHG
jgi:hypothetical protein